VIFASTESRTGGSDIEYSQHDSYSGERMKSRGKWQKKFGFEFPVAIDCDDNYDAGAVNTQGAKS
jgi:hypothetical protein